MVPGLEGISTSEERYFKMATVEEVTVNLLSLKASVLEKNICERAPEANIGMMSSRDEKLHHYKWPPKQLSQLTQRVYTHVKQ